MTAVKLTYPSPVEINARIGQIQQQFAQKFAVMDEPSNAIGHEATGSQHQTEAAEGITTAMEVTAHNETTGEGSDIIMQDTPADSTIAQPDRRDSKAPTPTTPPTPPDSIDKDPHEARNNLFSHLETMERIFLELEIKHLLTTVQRVCRDWNSIISNSERLQKSLFFLPLSALVEPRGEHFYKKRYQDFQATLVFQNPLLDHLRRVFENLQHRKRIQNKAELTFLQAKRRAIFFPNASWRRMLAYQPPVRNMDFEHDSWINVEEVENVRGLTLRNTAGDHYLYWRNGCFPVEGLFETVLVEKRAKRIRVVQYDPVPMDGGEKRYGWMARCVEESLEDESLEEESSESESEESE